MLARFCLYGFLKNQQYYDPFLILAFREKGLSFAQIGLLIGFRELCINLLEIPTGAIADTVGRRKAMILSHLAYLVSFATFAFSSHLATLVSAMLFFSLGEAFRTGTHKAIIFSWLTHEDRADEKTRIYGITRSWSKIGSALGVVMGAILVFTTQSYRSIFLFSMLPISLNIINFISYPAYLDGTIQHHMKMRTITTNLWHGVRQCFSVRKLRRLLLESMCFEGVYRSSKDYLQPILKQTALALPFFLVYDTMQRTALLVGSCYFILYILSSIASRHADSLVRKTSSPNRAAQILWIAYLAVFLSMLIGMLTGDSTIIIGTFAALALIQNFWRPILIGRIADQSSHQQMATVLSVESQSKTLFAALAAPFIGWLIDQLSGPLEFTPIAMLGTIISILVLTNYRRKLSTKQPM